MASDNLHTNEQSETQDDEDDGNQVEIAVSVADQQAALELRGEIADALQAKAGLSEAMANEALSPGGADLADFGAEGIGAVMEAVYGSDSAAGLSIGGDDRDVLQSVLGNGVLGDNGDAGDGRDGGDGFGSGFGFGSTPGSDGGSDDGGSGIRPDSRLTQSTGEGSGSAQEQSGEQGSGDDGGHEVHMDKNRDNEIYVTDEDGNVVREYDVEHEGDGELSVERVDSSEGDSGTCEGECDMEGSDITGDPDGEPGEGTGSNGGSGEGAGNGTDGNGGSGEGSGSNGGSQGGGSQGGGSENGGSEGSGEGSDEGADEGEQPDSGDQGEQPDSGDEQESSTPQRGPNDAGGDLVIDFNVGGDGGTTQPGTTQPSPVDRDGNGSGGRVDGPDSTDGTTQPGPLDTGDADAVIDLGLDAGPQDGTTQPSPIDPDGNGGGPVPDVGGDPGTVMAEDDDDTATISTGGDATTAASQDSLQAGLDGQDVGLVGSADDAGGSADGLIGLG